MYIYSHSPGHTCMSRVEIFSSTLRCIYWSGTGEHSCESHSTSLLTVRTGETSDLPILCIYRHKCIKSPVMQKTGILYVNEYRENLKTVLPCCLWDLFRLLLSLLCHIKRRDLFPRPNYSSLLLQSLQALGLQSFSIMTVIFFFFCSSLSRPFFRKILVCNSSLDYELS